MPDLLVTGTIHTLDPSRPRAEAVVVRDGRIAAVGDREACAGAAGPGARRIDLGAGCAVPGLVDAHGHVAWHGRARLEVACAGAEDAAACAARAAARARTLPAGRWVRGGGWDQNRWPGGAFPDADLLSAAVPGHPAFLTRVDGHAAWVNRAALAAAGIGDGTPDPPGGRIHRDAAGRATGILVDSAMALALQAMPRPTAAELEEAILAALQELAGLGLTAVHDAGCEPEVLDVLRGLAEAGRLPLRVYAMILGDPPLPALRAELARWRGGFALGRLEIRAVKLFADGALGSRGAALLEDYADDPGNRGLLLTEPALLREKLAAVVEAGLQPAVHAIGDRANREVIEAFLAAGPALRALRPRLEHLQIVQPGDLPRLAASGAIASMQPTHATSDAGWFPARLGEGTARLRGAYAWRSTAAAGVPLAFGSDFPIESPDPRLGLLAAEERRGPDGRAFSPEERLGRLEALRAFTSGAARAAFAEDRRGVIREGLEADLTLLGQDLLAVEAEALPRVPVTATVVAGEVVWAAGSG
ncbi:MAG: amidohydrolase [Anaeromyxobacter sp.]